MNTYTPTEITRYIPLREVIATTVDSPLRDEIVTKGKQVISEFHTLNGIKEYKLNKIMYVFKDGLLLDHTDYAAYGVPINGDIPYWDDFEIILRDGTAVYSNGDGVHMSPLSKESYASTTRMINEGDGCGDWWLEMLRLDGTTTREFPKDTSSWYMRMLPTF